MRGGDWAMSPMWVAPSSRAAREQGGATMAQRALRAGPRGRAWPGRLRYAAVLAAVAALTAAFASAASATVRIVSQTKTGTNYYSTIQSAVNATHEGDWV